MTGLKKAVAAAALLVMMSGCATGADRRYVEAAASAANYTDKYIRYSLLNTKDKLFGLGGSAKPFYRGGGRWW
jgi:hypothetical protein